MTPKPEEDWNEKIQSVVTKIFYSVATNGQAEASINAGINDVKNLLAGYASAPSSEAGEWQLCPKCFGDGNLGRYNCPPYMSTNVTPICDVCNGNKIIAKPLITQLSASSEATPGKNSFGKALEGVPQELRAALKDYKKDTPTPVKKDKDKIIELLKVENKLLQEQVSVLLEGIQRTKELIKTI